MAFEFSDRIFRFHSVGGYEMVFEESDYTTGAYPRYYGYLARDGAWAIAEHTKIGNVLSMRYTMGASDYATNWTGRAGLTYGLYSALKDL